VALLQLLQLQLLLLLVHWGLCCHSCQQHHRSQLPGSLYLLLLLLVPD
jgi:hypothetical protein